MPPWYDSFQLVPPLIETLGINPALPWTTISFPASSEYSAALYCGSFSRASL